MKLPKIFTKFTHSYHCGVWWSWFTNLWQLVYGIVAIHSPSRVQRTEHTCIHDLNRFNSLILTLYFHFRVRTQTKIIQQRLDIVVTKRCQYTPHWYCLDHAPAADRWLLVGLTNWLRLLRKALAHLRLPVKIMKAIDSIGQKHRRKQGSSH